MSVFATVVIQFYISGSWVDVPMSTDVRAAAPIVCAYGITGNTPNDRVASAGTLEFALNNLAGNSGGVAGYYSPLNASKRSGYDMHLPVRLKITYGAYTRYKFLGKLNDILPTAGVREDGLVHCQALDWMDQAATVDCPDVATQFNKRSDELVTLVLDALDSDEQPAARDIETGLETYAIALDGGAAGSRPKLRDILNQICLSEGGYCYVKGDAVQGGTLQFENRHHRASNPTVQITLDDDAIVRGGVTVPARSSDIYSSVKVTVYSTSVDAAATTVLYALRNTTTLIEPGETLDTIFGPYRDPSNQDLIGGTETVDPVATTDYTMNTSSDGLGSDLTSNFTVTASRSNVGVRFSITNNGATAGYITKLQLRGKGIYRYPTTLEVAVGSGYGERPFEFFMPYQNNVNVGNDFATFLANVLSNPFARAPEVRFKANTSDALMIAAVTLEPGDRIAVQETRTGLDAEFTINSVRLECQAGGEMFCTWGLEPADPQHYWLWGIDGSSNWGISTVYGF